jgi:hypothetical protein
VYIAVPNDNGGGGLFLDFCDGRELTGTIGVLVLFFSK